MGKYRHHVSGFFANHVIAESTLNKLIEQGLHKENIYIFESASVPSGEVDQAKSNEVLKDMAVDGAIGAAVGTGIGALAEVALVAANVSLFIASPLIAPLALLGWGASLGGMTGATIGAKVGSEKKQGWLSDLIQDAIASGQVVLVAETKTKQETEVAKEVIQTFAGNSQDVSKT